MNFVLRSFALALALAALVPWSSARHERLVVVAVDGAHLETIRRFVNEGELPHFAALMRDAITVSVSRGGRRDPREFWRLALRSGDGRLRAPEYVWNVAADAGIRAAAIAVPETREMVSAGLLVAPGADEAEGFIGDNVGRFVDVDSDELRDMGWPYTAGMPTARAEMARLDVGQASSWMSLGLDSPDARRGFFRVYRAAERLFYVSPVYRFARPAKTYVASAPADLLYVADDPSWAFADPVSVPPFSRHVRDVTAARFEVALRVAAERRRLLVYFDPLIALTSEPSGTRRDASDSDVGALRGVYATIDARVGALARAAGTRSIAAVIGREPATRGSDMAPGPGPTGFVILAGAAIGVAGLQVDAEIASIAPTLLHLIDVSTDGAEPIPAIAARFPRNDAQAPRSLHAAAHADSRVPLTPESLRALGLLSQSTRAPALSAFGAGDEAAASPGSD